MERRATGADRVPTVSLDYLDSRVTPDCPASPGRGVFPESPVLVTCPVPRVTEDSPEPRDFQAGTATPGPRGWTASRAFREIRETPGTRGPLDYQDHQVHLAYQVKTGSPDHRELREIRVMLVSLEFLVLMD